MSMVLLSTGLLLFGSGLVVYLLEYRVCQRIVQQTAGQPDALTSQEIWLNTQMFTKQKKLLRWAESEVDSTLKRDAALALRLGYTFQSLAICGMVLTAIGAACFA
ncbi:MAG: hypothetical protein KDA69_14670 [Planctomycetaceae bacterium]|nr:hypothetical protein [Planctomycetaceae bacterium]